MLKTLWDDTTRQRLINYISNYRSTSKQSWRIGVGIGSRSQDFFGISWSTSFMQSFVISLNSAKGFPENSTVSQGKWSVRVKAASNQFNLTNKNFTKLIRKRFWGNVWGQDSTSECAHRLIAKTEITYQVWHHIALLCINLPMHS